MAEGQSGAGRWAKPRGGREHPPLRRGNATHPCVGRAGLGPAPTANMELGTDLDGRPHGAAPTKGNGSRRLTAGGYYPPLRNGNAMYPYAGRMRTSAPTEEPHACLAGGHIGPPLRDTPKARRRAARAQHFPYGRGGEAKLRRKFFAKLSFKKAGKKAGRGWPGVLPASRALNS